MAIYSVHVPRVTSSSATIEADRVQFVGDRFSWSALIFGPFWLVWHRMWWVLAGFLITFAPLPALASLAGISEIGVFWILVAYMLFFALEAASLRRWSLALKGFFVATMVSGQDQEECERKFFAQWSPPGLLKPAEGIQTPPLKTKKTPMPNKAETGVIGVFPASGAHK